MARHQRWCPLAVPVEHRHRYHHLPCCLVRAVAEPSELVYELVVLVCVVYFSCVLRDNKGPRESEYIQEYLFVFGFREDHTA